MNYSIRKPKAEYKQRCIYVKRTSADLNLDKNIYIFF